MNTLEQLEDALLKAYVARTVAMEAKNFEEYQEAWEDIYAHTSDIERLKANSGLLLDALVSVLKVAEEHAPIDTVFRAIEAVNATRPILYPPSGGEAPLPALPARMNRIVNRHMARTMQKLEDDFDCPYDIKDYIRGNLRYLRHDIEEELEKYVAEEVKHVRQNRLD